MPKAESFWKHYAATKRYATHCSIDALFHTGALKITHLVGLMRDIEKNRPDLARRIAKGERVTIRSPIDGEMIVHQEATLG